MSIFEVSPVQTGWAAFREYVNGKELGFNFKRSDLLVLARTKHIQTSSMDNFRNLMVRAGFFKIIARGTYEFVNKIPVGTTTSEMHTLAYGSKLVYLEKVVARKERERRQAEEDARLLELQRVNTAILIEARSKPCMDCNLPLPDYVKIFSYRYPQDKYHAMSQMISVATSRLRTELGKCDLICLNCHAVRLHEGKHSVYSEIQA